MHRRLAARFVVPLERPVGKKYFHAFLQHPVPKSADLFALRNGIGGNKGTANRCSFDHLRGLHIPGGHIIQKTGIFYIAENSGNILALLIVHELRSHKRRVAHDVTEIPGGRNFFPVDGQRVAADNLGAGLQRNARIVEAELFGNQQVHLVIHQPQRHLRNLRGKFLNLDAGKLVNIEINQPVNAQLALINF